MITAGANYVEPDGPMRDKARRVKSEDGVQRVQ
jgi:hypothetical protein